MGRQTREKSKDYGNVAALCKCMHKKRRNLTLAVSSGVEEGSRPDAARSTIIIPPLAAGNNSSAFHPINAPPVFSLLATRQGADAQPHCANFLRNRAAHPGVGAGMTAGDRASQA